LDVAAALQNGSAAPGSRRKSSGGLLFPIEVQIRTEQMNRLAENGIAIESWSCGGGSWRRAGGDGSSDEWDAAGAGAGASEASQPAGSNGNSNGSAGSRFPFDLGRLVSSMTGGGGGGSGRASTNGAAAPSRNGAAPGSNGAVNGTASANGSSLAGAAVGSNGSGAPAALGEGSIDPQVLSRRINWLKSIREWQSEFVGTLTGGWADTGGGEGGIEGQRRGREGEGQGKGVGGRRGGSGR
jgi:hypothetical protein